MPYKTKVFEAQSKRDLQENITDYLNSVGKPDLISTNYQCITDTNSNYLYSAMIILHIKNISDGGYHSTSV